MRTLVIEDDARLRQLLKFGLGEEGFAVDLAGDGIDGLHCAMTATYDVVVLDLMLPGIAGDELLRRLRRSGLNTPVLILSARDSAADRVDGLDRGADDYLVKPFVLSELVARLRALVRRSHGAASAVIEVGPLRIDLSARTVHRGEEPIELRAKEFAILELLVLRRGRIVTRTEIQDHVWGHDNDTLSNVVDVHVCRLRNQIERDGRALIRTRRGLGYQIDAPNPR